jgi:hypothetical protein
MIETKTSGSRSELPTNDALEWKAALSATENHGRFMIKKTTADHGVAGTEEPRA